MDNEQHEQLIEEIKELRRTVCAGFTILTAQFMQSNDNGRLTDNDYINKSFDEIRTKIIELRSND
jgi:hypothetical protein